MIYFNKWGPSARTCLALVSGTMTENLLESKVNLAAKKFAEDPVALTTMETDLENNSHLLFTTFPVDHNRDISTLRVATQHLHHIIKNAVSNIDAARQISFYFRASGDPYFRGAFGYVFEKLFYVWLSSNSGNELLCTPALPSGSAKSRSTDLDPEWFCIQPVGWERVIVHEAKRAQGAIKPQINTESHFVGSRHHGQIPPLMLSFAQMRTLSQSR